MTLTATAFHASLTGAAANPNVLVDGPKWDAGHTVTISGTLSAGDYGLTSSAFITLGTGVGAALAIAVGSAGAPVLFNGALGTPSSGTGTNLTGIPISTGLTGAGTGVLTALAVNVGSAGAFITFNGALGTPSSGTATNLTGLPISSGLTGAGTGVLAALAVNIGTAGSFVVNGGALGSPSSAGTLPAFTLGGTVTGGSQNITGLGTIASAAHTVTSASANALAVGANGTTNPAFNVDDSTASVATGWNVKGAAAAGKAALAVISSGTNEAGTIDGKGSGNLLLQTVATGNVGIQNTSPISTLSVGGTGNSNTDTSFEISIAGNVTAQAFNRHTTLYSVLVFAGANVNFQSGSTASVATQLSLQGGVLLGGGSTDPGAGNVQGHGFIKSESPTGGIGYATGAGGAITQLTSRTTGVTLNTACGAITLFAAAPAVGTWVSFTVTSSAVVATDIPHVSVKSGTNTYIAHVTSVGSGTFQISFTSIVGTASDSPVINFAVIKGVTS